MQLDLIRPAQYLSEPRTEALARPPSKTFRHAIDIYLKDSNAYANTYFARYFEWQGVCRERWFHQCIASDLLRSEGVFITRSAHQDYVRETFPFQTVECLLNTSEVARCSFNLLFRFRVDGALVCTGYQQIVFAREDRKIRRLPDDVIDRIRQYEWSGHEGN